MNTLKPTMRHFITEITIFYHAAAHLQNENMTVNKADINERKQNTFHFLPCAIQRKLNAGFSVFSFTCFRMLLKRSCQIIPKTAVLYKFP